jgi:hypothetical protein
VGFELTIPPDEHDKSPFGTQESNGMIGHAFEEPRQVVALPCKLTGNLEDAGETVLGTSQAIVRSMVRCQTHARRIENGGQDRWTCERGDVHIPERPPSGVIPEDLPEVLRKSCRRIFEHRKSSLRVSPGGRQSPLRGRQPRALVESLPPPFAPARLSSKGNRRIERPTGDVFIPSRPGYRASNELRERGVLAQSGFSERRLNGREVSRQGRGITPRLTSAREQSFESRFSCIVRPSLGIPCRSALLVELRPPGRITRASQVLGFESEELRLRSWR